jgi:hypothetical protein
MQFYFLSIVINLLAGVILAGDYLAQRLPWLKSLLPEISNRSSGVAIGAITAGVGVLKLFVLANPLQTAVVGDLLPALGGIVLGGVLISVALNAVEDDADGGVERPVHTTKEGSSHVVVADGAAEKAVRLAAGYRTPAGLAGIAVALLHFLFPGSVIL